MILIESILPKRKRTHFDFDVAGLKTGIEVPDSEIKLVHKPILNLLKTNALKKGDRSRYIVFLAGLAGSGKSTLASLWEKLALEDESFSVPFQVLPMDGFHYLNSFLDTHFIKREDKEIPLHIIKGAPETFDFGELSQAVRLLQEDRPLNWPVYDRTIRDPVPDVIRINDKGIIIIEGNYLLLNEDNWRDLALCADFRIFLDANNSSIKRDIISRHQKVGRSSEEAKQHYVFNDEKNNERIKKNLLTYDLMLFSTLNRRIKRKK